ncbi:MAG: GNAT family N-acetyltransferase [Proteobacteria bacterium]|nr:GNAT family N-acetyltransferase [Pseudomonadota bacterium]
MEATKNTGHQMIVRQAFPDDLAFLRSLALEAFSVYGDYETVLTDFFVSEGVHTYVAEESRDDGNTPVGILMMIIRKEKRRGPYFAEIVAIAVEEARRNQGIGSQMIEFAKQWPLSFSGQIPISEVRLSVAESNVKGQSFFHRHGFEINRTEPWTYPAGQKALRMRYILKKEN